MLKVIYIFDLQLQLASQSNDDRNSAVEIVQLHQITVCQRLFDLSCYA